MHLSDVLMLTITAAAVVAAYLRDPVLPGAGLRTGGQMFLDVLPRLVVAMVLAGMLQVLISPQWVQRWLGESAGHRGILVGFAAGVLTPGGPMISFPMVAAFHSGGAGLPALVTYITSWSLFGFQRILAWELPLMGGRFVVIRVIATVLFPIAAGYVVRFIYQAVE